jgi:putative two-component system response regulator
LEFIVTDSMQLNTAHEAVPVHTILMVDDTPQNLTILGELLRPMYRVRAANSGERALRAAHSDPRPDLILLDVMMSDMDGYEVMRRLHQDPLTCDIPVIFITALSSMEDEALGLELGAVDYITKPFNGIMVLTRVRTHLELKSAREHLARHDELSRRMNSSLLPLSPTDDIKNKNQ